MLRFEFREPIFWRFFWCAFGHNSYPNRMLKKAGYERKVCYDGRVLANSGADLAEK
jgi:hypothetical protein